MKENKNHPNPEPRILAPYLHPKLLIVLFLGFSSGLPLLLVGGTLGAWLSDAGLDKATIGAFALVAVPYSFNFVWAPLIDHLRLPFLTRRFGRRRGWMLFIQACLAGVLALLAFSDPGSHPFAFAWIAVGIAFFSASQDVVIDAFRAEYLEPRQYGEGAAMAVFGYRLGMLVAGAGALALADQTTWPIVYLAMAACMAVGMLAVLCAREPQNPLPLKKGGGVLSGIDGASGHPPPQSSPSEGKGAVREWLINAFVMPFRDFMQRYPYWLLILLFILCYRIPDGFIAFITTPFFLDIGFTKSEIAAIAKIYGFGATLLGMFVGGSLIRLKGVRWCLLSFLLFQMVANLIYAGFGAVGPRQDYLMLAISVDNLSGGMVTAAAIAYMMRLCNLEYTATQYALLSSLASLASKTLAGSAGLVAEWIGWSGMFAASALMGLPALLLWWRLRAKGALLVGLDAPKIS